MDLENKIVSRMNDLIKQGEDLRLGDSEDCALNRQHMEQCNGWIAAVRNIVHVIFTDNNASYKKHIEEVANKDHGWLINSAVGTINELLYNLRFDFENGLLSSIADGARAEVFDDFLDHAKSYLDNKRKNEAGVIAGVVFEDTLRRICKNYEIDESGKKLDGLISALTSNGTISAVMAKRARASAHVRTKATHAQWEEFELDDVRATIAFTEELIFKRLDN